MWLADNWKDYKIIDTSDGEKLEYWGKYSLIRPDPQIIWSGKRNVTATYALSQNTVSLIIYYLYSLLLFYSKVINPCLGKNLTVTCFDKKHSILLHDF